MSAKAKRELLTVQRVPLGELRLNPRNPRTISESRFEALKQSLVADPEMMMARPVIALPDGTILGGNMRFRAAEALGWSDIPTVFMRADQEKALTIALRDNRPYGSDDEDMLAEMLYELEQASTDLLPLTGFAGDELQRLLDSVRGDSLPGADQDAVPPLPAEPHSKLGEVYELGPHRLYVGNAIDALESFYPDVKAVCVLADPPYGISLDTDYRPMGTGSEKAILRGVQPNVYAPVTGDDEPFDPAPYIAAFAKVREQFWFGGDYYRRRLSADDRDGAYLVWDKRNEASDGGFGSGFELIWSRQPHKRDLLRHYFFGAFGVDGANRMHPTQKPVPLLMEILQRWAPPGGIVADPFVGSGSTLIACERTGHICYACEVEPAYADVVRQRYTEFVG